MQHWPSANRPDCPSGEQDKGDARKKKIRSKPAGQQQQKSQEDQGEAGPCGSDRGAGDLIPLDPDQIGRKEWDQKTMREVRQLVPVRDKLCCDAAVEEDQTKRKQDQGDNRAPRRSSRV